jgi:hypothetical protein
LASILVQRNQVKWKKVGLSIEKVTGT